MSEQNGLSKMEKIVSLCKRRGFVFPSSEIYGGLNSCYDYGPLGVALKNNIKRFWLDSMTLLHENIVGLDSSILMHPKIWEASGHVAHFTDPLVDCKRCQGRFRADHLQNGQCPSCKDKGQLTEARQFNLMFKTFMGPVEEAANVVYLRPETAQGIYVNAFNVMAASRLKIPFGIAQIGKAFRNEITPGNFTFRTREFEQMEMQYFCSPAGADAAFEEWLPRRHEWYRKLGIQEARLRFHPHGPGELAHYAKRAFDIEYEFPFGWQELEGVHHRSDYDLSQHQKFCGKNLQYFDEATKERYIPYVVETSAGCDRTTLCCLCDAFEEEGERTVLRFAPPIAPLKLAVLPLVNRDGMDGLGRELFDKIRTKFPTFYDDGGSIGRRYRRQDEAGTPFCATIDSQSLADRTVTVRYRDSMKQERLSFDGVEKMILEAIALPL